HSEAAMDALLLESVPVASLAAGASAPPALALARHMPGHVSSRGYGGTEERPSYTNGQALARYRGPPRRGRARGARAAQRSKRGRRSAPRGAQEPRGGH